MLKHLALFALITASSSASAQTTARDVDAAIDRGRLVHPYVYFTAAEKAALIGLTKTDAACGDKLAQLLAEANRLLSTPVDDPPARVRNARYAGTYDHENWLQRQTGNAYSLALAYQMTGDERYVGKAFEFADAVCDQPTWVHGAHEFPEIYDRVWPWGAKDDEVVFDYAQWTDHLVVQLAAVYDWLYPALAKRERDRIRGALLEKAILRVRGNYEYHWWAGAFRCNWCAVLNGSLGIASIALLTEDPGLVDVIAESYNRVGKTLDEVRDGGWAEGVSYMGYMLTESMRFADVLDRVTAGKMNLFHHPRIPDALGTLVWCGFPGDRTVHFGDSGSGAVGSYNLFNRLAAETGNPLAFWLRDNKTGNRPGELLEYFVPRAAGKGVVPVEPSRAFTSTGWVILRSDFTDREKVSIACKSGLNNDPHHGHLDQGHASLFWRGKEFLTDHGSAGYDRKYFDRERWDYPLAATRGHNTVMVDGEEQVCGKLKNEPWDETVGGKIVLFRPGKERDYTILDPSGAYPGKHLKGWRRHVVLEKPGITVILDEITSAKGSEIEARFHSEATMTARGNYVSLKSGGDEMALIPACSGAFTLRPGSHAILMAQKNASFRTVPYVGVVTKAAGEKTILAAVVLPVTGAVGTDKWVRLVMDDGVVLTFTDGGKKYEYRFSKGPDGLVME